MLRNFSRAVRPSTLAGTAIYGALKVANRLTLKDDPFLAAYRDLPKPLVATSAAPDPFQQNDVCSLVYKGVTPPPRAGSLKMPDPRNTTLVNTLKASCEQFAGRRAMGMRPLERLEKRVKMVDGAEKVWDVYHLGPSRYYTYAELWEAVENFGRGLMELGLRPDARVALCEETRAEWFVACYGVWFAGATGCTVYANMNANALEHALGQMEATHAFTNSTNLPHFIKYYQRPEYKGAVPVLIYTDTLDPSIEVPKEFTVLSFTEVLERGKASSAVPLEPHTPTETALIMYTSGTTGKPKGVMISHENLLSTIHTLGNALDHIFGDSRDVTYLAYLPLAHILEFACENTLLHRGMLLCYGSPRTLTNASAEPHGDLQEFRPHFMCGVPRVFDAIRKTAYEKLEGSPVLHRVFDCVYNDKVRLLRKGKSTPFYDKYIFAKIQQTLGGRLVAVLSGGAPLSSKVQQFMQACVTPVVVQGYGLTETCACTSIMYPGDLTKKSVGLILKDVEVKLRDVAEWKHTDTPEPRGEILIRGPVVTKGYYKRPEKTAQSYLEGGWFATGDVGSITADGGLRIVGRVESLIKNSNGEYIAVEALESIYCLNALASPNSVCVLVDQHKDYICAIALTDMHKTMAWAEKHGLAGEWPSILEDPAFKREVIASFRRTGINQGRLKSFELLKDVALLHDEWTAENGCLTAAMKIKRSVVLDRHQNVIKRLFAE